MVGRAHKDSGLNPNPAGWTLASLHSHGLPRFFHQEESVWNATWWRLEIIWKLVSWKIPPGRMPGATRNSGNSGNLKCFQPSLRTRNSVIATASFTLQKETDFSNILVPQVCWKSGGWASTKRRMKLLAGAPPIHQRHKCLVVDQLEDAHRLPRLPCRSLVFKRGHDNVPKPVSILHNNPETRRYFFETVILASRQAYIMAAPCKLIPKCV